ncbi:MAG: hypothetical protein H6832_18455 [Planctomycetes bacterium]|nr:hypothetical protein [Planctomycetota bacterium]MCB9920390.1 hypothetical protein [Planctomycetota bacterium]
MLRYFTNLALFVFAGCSTLRLDLPREFLVTESSTTELKATTADEAIFWVQAHPLQGDAGLDFWIEALKHDLVDNRGYALLREEPVMTNSAGTRIALQTFESTFEGSLYRYLVAVAMQPGPSVLVARFTAERETFEKHVDAVRHALTTSRW